MAETLLSPATRDHASSLTLGVRKQALADILEGKVEQGYRIEDRTHTGATLVSRSRRRRRWFGVSRSGNELRQTVSVDAEGGMAMRKMDG